MSYYDIIKFGLDKNTGYSLWWENLIFSFFKLLDAIFCFLTLGFVVTNLELWSIDLSDKWRKHMVVERRELYEDGVPCEYAEECDIQEETYDDGYSNGYEDGFVNGYCDGYSDAKCGKNQVYIRKTYQAKAHLRLFRAKK